MHIGLWTFLLGNQAVNWDMASTSLNDSPRLSQQTPEEWTYPAPSSSLWKPSCLLNELIEPYEMCVISGDFFRLWYSVNESGVCIRGLYWPEIFLTSQSGRERRADELAGGVEIWEGAHGPGNALRIDTFRDNHVVLTEMRLFPRLKFIWVWKV